MGNGILNAVKAAFSWFVSQFCDIINYYLECVADLLPNSWWPGIDISMEYAAMLNCWFPVDMYFSLIVVYLQFEVALFLIKRLVNLWPGYWS